MGMSAFGVEDNRAEIEKAVGWSTVARALGQAGKEGAVKAGQKVKAGAQYAGTYLPKAGRGAHRVPETVGQKISGGGARFGASLSAGQEKVTAGARRAAQKTEAAGREGAARVRDTALSATDRYKKLTPVQRRLAIGGAATAGVGGVGGGGYALSRRNRD